MNTTIKLCAYGAVLVLLLTGGYVLGGAVGPVSTAHASGGHGQLTGDVAYLPVHPQGASAPTVAAPNPVAAPNSVVVPGATAGGHGH